jgi:hypothetical protein
MWWDNQNSLKETEMALSGNKYNNVKLFLGIANTVGADIDTLEIKKDTTRSTLYIRSKFELADCLANNKSNGLNFKYNFYRNENHGTVPLIATYDALHYIFDFYNLSLTSKDYSDTSLAFAYKIENHYNSISEKIGYEVRPPENDINTYAYTALMKKNFNQADYLFKLNMKNYPESFNVSDSYGDYYRAVGDNRNARVMYEKALSIMEFQETRVKLEQIKAKK